MKIFADIYKLLKEHGTRTGSRVWKVHNKDSDYDYLIPNSIYIQIKQMGIDKIVTFYDQAEDPDYEGNPTFYFEYKGRTFNVISPRTIHDYQAWEWATGAMKLIDINHIKNRDIRVELFKNLRKFYIEFIYDDVPF